MNCKYCSFESSCKLCVKRHLHQIHNNCEFCYFQCLEPEHHLSLFICDCEVKNKPKLKVLEPLDSQFNKGKFRQSSLTCELCPDLFPYAVTCVQKMAEHKLRKHPQRCQYCPYKAVNNVNLRKHISRSHRTIHKKIRDLQKSYSCKLCEYSGATHGALRLHMGRRHSNEINEQWRQNSQNCELYEVACVRSEFWNKRSGNTPKSQENEIKKLWILKKKRKTFEFWKKS